DTKAATVALAEICRHIVQIGHAGHITPDFRYGHDNISVTETQFGFDSHALFRVRQRLTNEVLASHAKIHAAISQLTGNFRSGKEQNIQIRLALDTGAIIARVIRQDHLVASSFKHSERLLLQPPLGRQCQRHTHFFSPASICNRSSQMEKPTPGMFSEAPSMVRSRSYRPPPARMPSFSTPAARIS